MKLKQILYIETDIKFGLSGNYEALNGVHRIYNYRQNLQKYNAKMKE